MDVGVLGIVATVLVGLVAILAAIIVTHLYHVRASREQKTLLGRLPDEIVDILKEDARDKLTIRELNDLIFEKSIDWDAPHQPGNPYTPWKACPRCGNTELAYSEDDRRPGHTYYITSCKECHWFEAGE